MFRKVHVVAVVSAVLGAALGYLAAAGHLNLFCQANAAPEPDVVGTAPSPGASTPGPRCNGVSKGELVALAAHNQQVAAKGTSSGKKPNILVLWGDEGHRQC
jgi:hypothetical protein